MTRKVALIAGATGHVGSWLAKELTVSGEWEVIGVSRSGLSPAPGLRSAKVDLLSSEVAKTISAFPKPTHVFYCARAQHREGAAEDIEVNLTMLQHVVAACEKGNANLEHVHIVEGGKWYGAHLGPYPTPAREDGPRHSGANFYYAQEDWLRQHQVGRSWAWSASRPSFVCAVTPGRGRNLVSTLGAYAALCAADYKQLDFPGSERSFASVTEVTAARLLARAMIFAATTPHAANQAFNVTNGDAVRWSEIWPKIAACFNMAPGPARNFSLATWARDKDFVWERVLRQHTLKPHLLSDVANWTFGDFVLGQDYDVLSDISKIQRAGFHERVNSTTMFFEMLADYRAKNILP